MNTVDDLFEVDTDQRQEDKFPARDSRVWQDSQEKVRNISADYTVTADDDFMLVDTTSADVNITLPDAISHRKFTVIKVAGANSVIVSPVGTDTVNGAADLTISDSYYPVQFKGIEGGYISTSLATGIDGLLPTQTGHNGEYLTTDGTNSSWADVLPTQTGHTGEYLTTDGSVASWSAITIPDPWTSVKLKMYFFSGF